MKILEGHELPQQKALTGKSLANSLLDLILEPVLALIDQLFEFLTKLIATEH